MSTDITSGRPKKIKAYMILPYKQRKMRNRERKKKKKEEDLRSYNAGEDKRGRILSHEINN